MPSTRYPLYLGPSEFFANSPFRWSKGEANEYFCWLLDVKKSRTDHMLDFLGVEPRLRPLRLWGDLGRRFSNIMRDEDFVEPSEKGVQPNAQGSALAADVGIFLGDALTARNSSALRWELFTKSKKYADFNQPVVSGWPYTPPTNFIRFSIVQAYHFARGEGDENILAKKFYALDSEAQKRILFLFADSAPKASISLLQREYAKRKMPLEIIEWRDVLSSELGFV